MGTQMMAGMTAGARGQMILIHGELNTHHDAPNLEDQFKFVLAAYLVIADNSSFFGFSDGWYYNGTTWHDEYDRPPGAPTGPATFDNTTGVWHREFEEGVVVAVDVENHAATISWV